MSQTTEGVFTTILQFSPTTDKVWGSIGLIAGVLTIIGNVLVFIVLTRMQKRSLSDCAFINLSIIDITSGLSAVAGSIYLINDRKWLSDDTKWGDVTCYITGMFWNTASLTTPLLVSVVSLGRLFAVYLPLRYDVIFTGPVVYTMLIYCWLHGIAASTLSLWGDTGSGRYTLYRAWGFCDQAVGEAYSSPITTKALYVIFFTVPMMITCTCIVLCNLLVTTRIIMMKATERKNSRRSLSVSAKESQSSVSFNYIRRMHELGRRISTNTARRFSSSAAQDSSFSYGGENSGRHYNHFEIVKLEENGSLIENKCGAKETSSCNKRKTSSSRQRKTIQKKRRAKRENRAILMTLLVSISYLVCYLEIINFYVSVSFGTSDALFGRLFGSHSLVKTYTNLWYYYSLFTAAAINALLHFLFNNVIRRGLSCKHVNVNPSSSINYVK